MPRKESTSSSSRSTSPDGQTPPSAVPSRLKTRRTRASNAKVKTGCLTCKRRHKKCDEARPSCMTCLTKGYKCDGYAVLGPKKPIDSIHMAAQQAQQSAWPAKFSTDPTFIPDLTPMEQRYFDLFCKYTVPQLAGGFESLFWHTFIPRASYHIPCVRHAAIALASLHEDFTRDRSVARFTFPTFDNNGDFTMNQYGRALQSLLAFVRQSGENSTEIVLSVCVLFICFEIIRGNHNAVLLHTQSGMNLLTDAVSRMSPQRKKRPSPVPLSAIAPVFTRIDIQASDIMDAMPLERYAHFAQPVEPSPVPKSFDSLEHSKQCLLEHQNYFMYKIREVVRWYGAEMTHWPPEEQRNMLKMRDYYINAQEQWYAAHDALARRDGGKRDSNTHRASSVLMVHYLLLRIALFRFPSIDEMDFDRFTGLFENIVIEAEHALRFPPTKDTIEHLTLSFDLGIAEPLFYVVTRCRHPRIRREALDLLKRCPSNEGIWNSSLAARIGEEIIDVEQRGSPNFPNLDTEKDIPRNARMKKGEPRFVRETGEMSLSFVDLFGNRCERQMEWNGPEAQMLLASQARPNWAMGKFQKKVKTRLRLKINTVPRTSYLISPSRSSPSPEAKSPLLAQVSFNDPTFNPPDFYNVAIPPDSNEEDAYRGITALHTLGGCHEYPPMNMLEHSFSMHTVT